jgi:hypothetical protein
MKTDQRVPGGLQGREHGRGTGMSVAEVRVPDLGDSKDVSMVGGLA